MKKFYVFMLVAFAGLVAVTIAICLRATRPQILEPSAVLWHEAGNVSGEALHMLLADDDDKETVVVFSRFELRAKVVDGYLEHFSIE